MKRPKVYVESSVISYYSARPGANPLNIARKQVAEQWWHHALASYELFISAVVIQEIQDGDPGAAAKRMAHIAGFKGLDANQESEKLAGMYLKRLGLPKNAFRDAAHLAIATVHAMDYLVTWNCAHIANGEIIRKLVRLNMDLGRPIPIIVTPEELMGGHNG